MPFETADEIRGPKVDAAALLLSLVRYVSHLDAVVYAQTRPNGLIDQATTQFNVASVAMPWQTSNFFVARKVVVSCAKPTTLTWDQISYDFAAGLTSLIVEKQLRPPAAVVLATQDGSAAVKMTLSVQGREYPIAAFSSGLSGG